MGLDCLRAKIILTIYVIDKNILFHWPSFSFIYQRCLLPLIPRMHLAKLASEAGTSFSPTVPYESFRSLMKTALFPTVKNQEYMTNSMICYDPKQNQRKLYCKQVTE
jgi:hypothetical protein